MNKDIIKESLIYDELGLSPLWVTLPKKVDVKEGRLPTKENILNVKKIKLGDLNVLFIAPIFNTSDTTELELFKKISTYLDTLSDKSKQREPLKMIPESKLEREIQLCEHLIFLEHGLDKLIEKENLTIPYISSVSLKEMVENPEKKRKLWQDIKELSKSINQ